MKKDRKYVFLTAAPLLLWLAGCTPALMKTNNQLHFGIQAAQKELWSEAIFRWEKVLETQPESGAAYNNLAVAYEHTGQWEKAEKAYEAAIKYDPNNKYIESNYNKFKSRTDSDEKITPDKKTNR